MSYDVEMRIAALAARQHGAVTHGQLIEAGLLPGAIGRRCRSGRLRRLHRGVYLATAFALEHTAEMAAVLAAPGGVLSHRSALGSWVMLRVGETPVDVSVTANRGRLPGIRLHRVARLEESERTHRYGIPITTPGRTLVDAALLVTRRELEAAIARAERAGLITREELMRLPTRYRRHPGVAALKAVLEIAGGPALTRSAAEEIFLALVREAGLPPPECNVALGRYEVDFYWRREGVVVEVDGFAWHGSRPGFEADRRKDADLAAAGLTVVRFSWRQITEERMRCGIRLWQILTRTSPGRV